MTHVIIAAKAIRDRVMPMVAMASDFLDRDHSVTFRTGSRVRDALIKIGARFAPLGGSADINPDLFKSLDRASLQELDRLNWDLQHARAACFIPFAALLPHANVLVSNGGYDGMPEALSFGVPLVLAGDDEEGIVGNARAAWTGAAINLQTQRPTVRDIHSAVLSDLDQKQFLRAMATLADAYRAAKPYESITQAVQGGFVS